MGQLHFAPWFAGLGRQCVRASFVVVMMFVAQLAHAGTASEQADACSKSSGDQAITACTWVIQSGQWTDTELANAFYNRGNAYESQGQYQNAIQDYEKTILLERSDLAGAINNRGNAYNHLGDHQRAMQDYEEAIRLKSDFFAAFIDRGNAYVAVGQYQRGIEDYDQAIRLKPDFAAAFNNRGTAYASLGQYERAIHDYDRAIQLKPEDANSFFNRGQAKLKSGDTVGGNADIARATAMGYKP